jgi:hypothetical protein
LKERLPEQVRHADNQQHHAKQVNKKNDEDLFPARSFYPGVNKTVHGKVFVGSSKTDAANIALSSLSITSTQAVPSPQTPG